MLWAEESEAAQRLHSNFVMLKKVCCRQRNVSNGGLRVEHDLPAAQTQYRPFTATCSEATRFPCSLNHG